MKFLMWLLLLPFLASAMDLAPVLKQRYFDANGLPLAGGKVYTYLAGTSTPTPTYTDQAGGTPNANPVILDSAGYAAIWLNSATSYKFVLKDSADATQFTVDSVGGGSGSSGGGWSTSQTYNITEGETSTALAGEVFDSQSATSAEYLAEIRRGTEIVANMRLVVQWKNTMSPEWEVYLGESLGEAGKPHGVDFEMITVGTVGQLYVFVTSGDGYGNGTLKLKKVSYGL